MIKLRACPFCGEKDCLNGIIEPTMFMRVECYSCRARGPQRFPPSDFSAVKFFEMVFKMWNGEKE